MILEMLRPTIELQRTYHHAHLAVMLWGEQFFIRSPENHYLFPEKSYLVFLVSMSTLDLSQGSLRSASLTTAYLSIVISLAGTTGGCP